MNKLREALWDLEGEPRIDDATASVVPSCRIDPHTGDLYDSTGSTDATYFQLEYDVGLILAGLTSTLKRDVEAAWGSQLSERDISLIEAGLLLSVRSVQTWVRLNPLPEPGSIPPGDCG